VKTPFLRSIGIVALSAASFCAQGPPAANYDESKVPPYTLPDPLIATNGQRATKDTWPARRRELLEIFAREMYGRTPTTPRSLGSPAVNDAPSALGGLAVRRQVTFTPAGSALGPTRLLIYRPASAKGPVPVFLSLNFKGNHAISDDPGIDLASSWLPDDDEGVVNHRATDRGRGTDRSRWPLQTILSRGYALATAYYGDFDPDVVGGFDHGVQTLFYKPGQHAPEADEWGAIGGWAWGLSRLLDYIETDTSLDGRRVAVLGHSRLGKAALWAAAQDERFALVISNESGCGGAALSKRIYGETVKAINDQFPHWFAGTFKKYNAKEADLPIDQHELLALIAPRPLYVASAQGDQWADPKGEFLSAVHAEPVYTLLGVQGLGVKDMPAADHPVGHTVRYHVRTGEHDVKPYDWEQYLAFADAQWKH
jgi:hypothetical protein